MRTIKNGNKFKGVSIGGQQIKGLYKNGEKFYEKHSYTPFATPILDLDFQNNFVDKSPSAITMIQGQGLPTFGLSGRKAGEYCAIFNGAQSIKTSVNLPLNSDKVCVKFWMKTTQTGTAIITEMSQNFNYNNAFIIAINSSTQNKLDLYDHTSGGSNYNGIATSSDINTGSWIHAVMTIDRSQNGTSQNKIYVNGVLSYVQNGIYTTDNNSNFVNNILYIGQRAGTSLGFNGSLAKYQVFNQVPTDAQAMEMYQNDL